MSEFQFNPPLPHDVFHGQNYNPAPSGFPTLEEIYSVPDIAPHWLWTADLVVPSLPALPRVLIADFQVPFPRLGVETRFRGGFSYSFPRFVSMSSINITFHETAKFDVTNYLMRWFNSSVDAYGNFNLPSNYFGTIALTMYDYLGKPAFQQECYSCWVEGITDWNLDVNSSQSLQVSATISVSRSAITYVSAQAASQIFSTRYRRNPLSNSTVRGSTAPLNYNNALIGGAGQTGSTQTIYA